MALDELAGGSEIKNNGSEIGWYSHMRVMKELNINNMTQLETLMRWCRNGAWVESIQGKISITKVYAWFEISRANYCRWKAL